MGKKLTHVGNHALVDYTPVTVPHTPFVKAGAWEDGGGGLINVRMANDVDHITFQHSANACNYMILID